MITYETPDLSQTITLGEAGSGDFRVTAVTRTGDESQRVLVDAWHSERYKIAGSIGGVILSGSHTRQEQLALFDAVLQNSPDTKPQYSDRLNDRRAVAENLAFTFRAAGAFAARHVHMSGIRDSFFEVKAHPDGLTLGNSGSPAVVVAEAFIPALLQEFLAEKQGFRCRQAVQVTRDIAQRQVTLPHESLAESAYAICLDTFEADAR